MARGFKRVHRDASLDEATVQKVAAGEAVAQVPTQATRDWWEQQHFMPTPSIAGDVITVTMDQAVMQAALTLAGGDRSRLHLNPDGSVLVLNHHGQKLTPPVSGQQDGAVCSVCGVTYVKQGWLRLHLQRDHPAPVPQVTNGAGRVVCPMCGSTYSKRDGLREHYQRDHPKEPMPPLPERERTAQPARSCTICGRNDLRGGTGLAAHIRHQHPQEWKKRRRA